MTTVRIEDARAIKYCVSGVRRFFGMHGLDFAQFVEQGIPADELPQDDYLAQQVIAQAMRREGETQ